jgi:hypothetical protein
MGRGTLIGRDHARRSHRDDRPGRRDASERAVRPVLPAARLDVVALQRHAGNARAQRVAGADRAGPVLQRALKREQVEGGAGRSAAAKRALAPAQRYLVERARVGAVSTWATDVLSMHALLETACRDVAELTAEDLAAPVRTSLLDALRRERSIVGWLARMHADDPKRLRRTMQMAALRSGRRLGRDLIRPTYEAIIEQLEGVWDTRVARIAAQQTKLDAFLNAPARRQEGWTQFLGWRLQGTPNDTEQTPPEAQLRVKESKGPPRLGQQQQTRPQDLVDKQKHWEGWKLHVRADPEQGGDLLEALAPRLSGAIYKVAQNLSVYDAQTGDARGKFLVVYPRTVQELLELTMSIEEGLGEVRAKHGRGQPLGTLSGDVPLGRSGDVFARYGYFTGTGEPPSHLIADGHRERARRAAAKGNHELYEFLVFDPALKLFVFDERAKTPLARRGQLIEELDAALGVLFGEARRAGASDRQVKRAALEEAIEVVDTLRSETLAVARSASQPAPA